MINMLFASIARFNSPARFAIITSHTTDLSGVRHNFRRLDTPVRLETLMLDRTIGQRRQIERIGHGETVAFLDTDILVQDDLGEIGRLDFDVAVTTRAGELPVNGGVLFARKNSTGGSVRFFDQVIERIKFRYSEYLQWNCDQLAFRDLVPLNANSTTGEIVTTEDRIRLALLPSSRFNYSPGYRAHEYERVMPDVSVAHFKGRRKSFMAEYFNMLTLPDEPAAHAETAKGVGQDCCAAAA